MEITGYLWEFFELAFDPPPFVKGDRNSMFGFLILGSGFLSYAFMRQAVDKNRDMQESHKNYVCYRSNRFNGFRSGTTEGIFGFFGDIFMAYSSGF